MSSSAYILSGLKEGKPLERGNTNMFTRANLLLTTVCLAFVSEETREEHELTTRVYEYLSDTDRKLEPLEPEFATEEEFATVIEYSQSMGRQLETFDT